MFRSEKDEEGPPFVEAEGLLVNPVVFPVEARRHLHNIKTMKLRPDDVLVCAFGKSGTHWTFEICSMLLRATAQYDRNPKVNLMLEFIDIPEIDAMPSPRVLNTHLAFRFLPWQLREKGARIVYVDRNPKDVAVSLFHHVQGLQDHMAFTGDFAQWLEAFNKPSLFGQTWFQYVQDWEKVTDVIKDLKLLWLHYEDMKEDMLREVRKLNDFLGTGASEGLMSEIAQACQFQRLKAADGDKDWRHDGFFKQEFRDQSGVFRKGEVGDWKNHFTPEQNDQFDRHYADQMKHSGLNFRFTL